MRFGGTTRYLGVCLLLVLCGCNARQQEAVEFNNRLTEFNQQLMQAHQQFFEEFHAQRDAGEIDKIRAAHKKLSDRFDAIQAEAEQVDLPEFDGAREFYDAIQRYIATEGKVIHEDYGEMIDVLEDRSLNSEAETNKLQAIIDRAHAAQEKSLAEVEAAQQAFAKQFELKLEN